MSGKKRKAIDDDVAYVDPKIKELIHCSISGRAIIGSPVVDIFVGEKSQVFSIHKALLALHSDYFHILFLGEAEENKITLPNVNSAAFAHFQSWLYYGKSFADLRAITSSGLWSLGNLLKAPAYQNLNMDAIYTRWDEKYPVCLCKIIPLIECIYQRSEKESQPRRFITDLMAYRNITRRFEEHCTAWPKCTAFFERCPDFKTDMEEADFEPGPECWKISTIYNQDKYMVKEFPLKERWDEQILARRSLEIISKEAENREAQSLIELDHLNRTGLWIY